MDENKFVCLGRFAHHSCYPWGWDGGLNLYYHECSLSGCSFSETAQNLIPIGQTMIIGEIAGHIPEWDHWKCIGDQLGLYIPPWLYKRKCRACSAEQMAEDLEKEKEI